MSDNDLRLERRMRRQAAKQGLCLVKSRCRTPEAPAWGGFILVDHGNWVVAGGHPWAFSMNIDQVAEYLTAEP